MGNKYKIENFESKILIQMTIDKEGYDPSSFSPKSNKYVWVSCRYCGEPNKTKKSKYTISGNSNCHKECRKKELKETDSTWSREDVKAKIKETLIERYGVDHSSKIDSAKEKKKAAFMRKYGVDNPSKSEEIKEKKRRTCLNNNGTEYPLQNPEIYEKSRRTVKKKYGVDRPAQNKEILSKTKDFFIGKFGTDNPMKNGCVKSISKARLINYINNDNKGKFKILNEIRDSENPIWDDIGNLSLKEVSKKYNIEYNKLRAVLYDNKDLRSKFLDIYTFPKQQKQNEVKAQIESLCNCEIRINDRKTISPLELDIYIPEKNFAIEFNGSFWHSEARLEAKEARRKHKYKTDLCREKGIRLFHIFEYQWDNRNVQIMNFIKTIIGANNKKIAARKCEITNEKCREFIDNNHIQGHGNGTIKYFNLTYNDEIVASMTASKHHRQNTKGNPIVLNRLCFKDGVSVQGGASKLFKKFVDWAKEEGYDRIISWSDSCWTEGEIYKVLRFSFEKEYNPDYFYWDSVDRNYKSKQSQMKKHTGCPEGMTERDWAFERGLYRIWNCGRKLWQYVL